MTAASLAAFRRTVTVDWPRARDQDARALLVRTAKEGHARIMGEQRARGAAPTFVAFANEPGRAIEAVKLPGPIVYQYHYLREVLVAALAALREASPVISGEYRDRHTLFINGIPVEGVPDRINPTDEFMIANPVPYSRRLEIGKADSGRDFVMQVPNRIYERVAKRKLIPRFRGVALITFEYVQLPNAWRIRGGLSATYKTGEGRKRTQKHGALTYVAGTSKVRKRRQKVGDRVMAPAIIIRAYS